ncbi:hypothetical protein G6F50_013727 [Rhizopus delemar]|uniref:Uncharacterized protein n=1 Tax=Rhizopus delemar TaxID=936053 RepID=A0A9P7CBH5_9FUNG|nr:hypothetical protein G6F50_013727 [Rhizopus delemar]
MQRLLQVMAQLGVLFNPRGGHQVDGEALAVLDGQPGGVQQRRGFLGVEGIARHVFGEEQRVAAEDGGYGGFAAAVIDGVDDELAVDGVQDGLAHLAAVDDVAALVEFGRHRPGRVLVATRVHNDLARLDQAVDVAGGNRIGIGQAQLARFQRGAARGGVGPPADDQLVQVGFARVPVLVVALVFHVAAAHPLAVFPRARAHRRVVQRVGDQVFAVIQVLGHQQLILAGQRGFQEEFRHGRVEGQHDRLRVRRGGVR